MPRYIDADTVVKRFDEIQPFAGNKAANAAINLCKDIVRNAPTISPDEVRGVVHCKDCKWCHAMVGIPHGLFSLGFRAVGDAFYCDDCVRTWKDRNRKEFDEQYPDAPHMFAMLWNKTVKQAAEKEGITPKTYREAANGDFVEVGT